MMDPSTEPGSGSSRNQGLSVTITKKTKGLRVLAALDAPIQGAHRSCLGDLTEPESGTLVRLLNRVRAEPG